MWSRRYIVILLALALVALGGVGVWIYWAHSQPGTASAQKTETKNTKAATTPATQKKSDPPADTTTDTGGSTTQANCILGDLSLNVAPRDSAAGSHYYDVVLTNHTNTVCTLQGGYPTVWLVDQTNQMVGEVASHDESQVAAQDVNLAAGASAAALMRVVTNNFDDGVCKSGAEAIRVSPPGESDSLANPSDLTMWCPGFSVGTFAPRS